MQWKLFWHPQQQAQFFWWKYRNKSCKFEIGTPYLIKTDLTLWNRPNVLEQKTHQFRSVIAGLSNLKTQKTTTKNNNSWCFWSTITLLNVSLLVVFQETKS
jgi:hypothetical protein